MKALIITLSLVCQLIGYGSALDFKGVEEYFTCDKFVVDSKLEEAWMSTVPIWHIPLWSKVDLYQNAEDFFGKEEFAKLTPEDVNKTCAYYKQNGTTVPVHGFGGRILNYEAFPDPVRKGITHWAIRDENGKRKYHATAYVTKTDNKSYFVAPTVWWNGRKGFSVNSATSKLDEKTLQEIKNHLIEIGFKSENFFCQDYDKCPPAPSSLASN